MAESVQVAAFEGGELRILPGEDSSREAVLALPLSRLIVRMVRVPAESKEDAVGFALPILQAASPFPDEPLTVSCETIRETPEGAVVLAAALPEGATDDIANALDAAKLSITRIDALALGQLRCLWEKIVGAESGDGARRLVLLKSVDCISVLVLDGDGPSAVRAVVGSGDLRREIMLSLLEAEDFGGPGALKEVVVAHLPVPSAPAPAEGETESPRLPDLAVDVGMLSEFAPVREVSVDDPDEALRGVAERSAETGTLDVLPASWREMLEETRFKAKLVRYLAIAGGIWLLVMAVLFGVPTVYGFMANRQKALCKEHRRQYNAVSEMKKKTELVRKYSDHSRGALEIMKAVSDRLPQGIELNNWNFKREEGVKVSGVADESTAVYEFKNKMDALASDQGVFGAVNLGGLTSSGKDGKQKFDLDCRYAEEDEE